MHTQHSVLESTSYANSPQHPKNNHLTPNTPSSAAISGDQRTNHRFPTDHMKRKLDSNKDCIKRVSQPPEIFVFNFTNVENVPDRTDQFKQNCMTNGNENNIDIPVTLDTLTQKSPLNPSTMIGQDGSPTPSLNPQNIIQHQQSDENIVPINNGNCVEGRIPSLAQQNLPNSKNPSPNCPPSQAMLWC